MFGEKRILPTAGFEPAIFGLGDRRRIHWATRAKMILVGDFLNFFLKNDLDQRPSVPTGKKPTPSLIPLSICIHNEEKEE